MMLQRKVSRILLPLFAVGALLVSACSGTSAPASGGDGASEIVLGAVLPLTGAEASVGKHYDLGYKMAVDEINKAGGLEIAGKKHPVKVIILDNKTDPTTNKSLYERLATVEKVDAFLGSYSTTLVKSEMIVAEQNKIPHMIAGAGSEELFAQGYKYSFGIIGSPYSMGKTTLEWLSSMQDQGKLPKPLSIAFLWENTSHGRDEQLALQEGAKSSPDRFKLVLDEPFEPYGKDFTPHLLKVSQAKADIFLADARLEDYILMHRTYTQMDLKHKVVSYGLRGPEAKAREALGPAADYLIAATIWSPELPYPQVAEFKKKWQEYTGTPASSFYGPMAYESVRILAKAMQNAGGTDKQKVRDALASIEFAPSIVVGQKVRFKPNGHIDNSYIVVQNIKDGKAPIVWPKDAAATEAVPIPGR